MIETYRTKGWAVAPAVLGDTDLVAWRGEAERLLAEPALFAATSRGKVLNGTQRSDRLDPVVDVSPVFAAAAGDPRIVSLVAEVLGGEPQLFKDKFIAKPPGAPGYGAHQDLVYWPGFDIDGDRLLTAIVFLDAADAANGALECAPGHHHEVLTAPGTVADPDESTLSPFETIEAEAGDVLLLHSLTPHRSARNQSGAMRRTLLLSYAVGEEPGLWGRYQRQRADVTAGDRP